MNIFEKSSNIHSHQGNKKWKFFQFPVHPGQTADLTRTKDNRGGEAKGKENLI